MLKRHHPPVYYDVQRVVSFIVRTAIAALPVCALALASIWTGGQGL